jgi:hypothetical protein
MIYYLSNIQYTTLVNMKNKLLLILTICLLLVSILFFKNYSITEINADNYESILVFEKKSISITNIDRYIPDNYALFSTDPTPVFNSKPEITRYDDGEVRTGIYIVENKNHYSANFISGEPYLVSITSDDISIRNIVDQLILKKGFSLKKTVYIDKPDIIIKELEDRFIIGVIYGHYDTNDLQIIRVESYSKNRFSHYYK